jgi:hypothetical protein
MMQRSRIVAPSENTPAFVPSSPNPYFPSSPNSSSPATSAVNSSGAR